MRAKQNTAHLISVLSDTELSQTSKLQPETQVRPRLNTLDFILIFALGLFFCIYNLGNGSFGEGDQTTHSLVVQHMYKSGDLLHPQYDGRPYVNKPPLKMLLATIPVALLGESNFSYRLIDGLSGLGCGLLVFYFAFHLFRSRAVAYFSLFSLFSSTVFFFGHGVRNAVQDSFMLFFMSLSTVIGYRLIEELPSASRRKLFTLATSGGLCIAAAVLAKSVPGYFGLAILALTLCLSGEILGVVRRGWPFLLLVLGLGLGIPAIYLLLQTAQYENSWRMLLITEVYKRAVVGYHFVNRRFYYFEGLFLERVGPAPELLLPSFVFGIYAYFKKFSSVSERRAIALLLSWSVVPLLAHSLASSKLMWYILPAIPGMSLLCGLALGKLFEAARKTVFDKIRYIYTSSLKAAALSLLLLFAIGSSAFQTWPIIKQITAEPNINTTDELVTSLREQEKLRGKPLRVIVYDPPRLTKHEEFYWKMLNTEFWPDANLELLTERLRSGEIDVVVSRLTDLRRILAIKPMRSYRMIKFRDRRRSWLVATSFSDINSKALTPAYQSINLEEGSPSLAFGWGSVAELNRQRFIRSKGLKSGVLLDAGYLLENFGADLKLRFSKTAASKNKPLDVEIYLNEQLVHTFKDISFSLSDYRFQIPADKWQAGKNMLTFKYVSEGIAVEEASPETEGEEKAEELFFLSSLKVGPAMNAAIEQVEHDEKTN